MQATIRPAMPRQHVRNQMIDNLTSKGWNASSWVKDIDDNNSRNMVEWTELWNARMRALYDLIHELDYTGAYTGGSFECPHEMLRMWARSGGDSHGPSFSS